MDLNINYYIILGVDHDSTESKIKKCYYNLSKELHPDKNKESDVSKFQQISEAYSILGNESLKQEYDRKSRFGKYYSEIEELFKIDTNYNHKSTEDSFDRVKNREILDITVKVDPEIFNGTLEYPRYVLCKTCKGSGKDLKSKIVIKDENGNIKGMFDADDGCDFCEGTGKDYLGGSCTFCGGQGKVGMKECQTCKGERRTLGKQKVSGIVLDGDETIVDAMGHLSYYSIGSSGKLIIRIS